MNLQLISGSFSAKDSLEIISQMMDVKIKYHEQKISNLQNEEDIKLREVKIKSLQNMMQECRNQFSDPNSRLTINATISIL